jgi:hypothetical protein
VTAPITNAEVNRLNEEFWAVQKTLLERRMADPDLRDIGLRNLNDEINKGVPIRFQRSIYQIFEDLASIKGRCLVEQARKGGSAKKQDALQGLILTFVEAKPSITEGELKEKLSAHTGILPIQDISDDEIAFTNHDGKTKTAAVSGLKDRLSRAKKEIHSR